MYSKFKIEINKFFKNIDLLDKYHMICDAILIILIFSLVTYIQIKDL